MTWNVVHRRGTWILSHIAFVEMIVKFILTTFCCYYITSWPWVEFLWNIVDSMGKCTMEQSLHGQNGIPLQKSTETYWRMFWMISWEDWWWNACGGSQKFPLTKDTNIWVLKDIWICSDYICFGWLFICSCSGIIAVDFFPRKFTVQLLQWNVQCNRFRVYIGAS